MIKLVISKIAALFAGYCRNDCIDLMASDPPPVPFLRKWIWGRRCIRAGISQNLVMHERVFLPTINQRKARRAAILTALQRIPFQIDQILIDAHVGSTSKRDDKIIADVFAVSKNDIRNSIRDLTANGYEITHIHPLNGGGQPQRNINFGNCALMDVSSISEISIRNAAVFCFAAALLQLMVSLDHGFQKKVMILSSYNKIQIAYIDRYNQETEFIDKILQQYKIIENFKLNNDSYDLLNSMYKYIPPTVKVGQVKIKPNYIEFSGETTNAKLLVESMKKNAHITNVKLIGLPIRVDNVDKFKIGLSPTIQVGENEKN